MTSSRRSVQRDPASLRNKKGVFMAQLRCKIKAVLNEDLPALATSGRAISIIAEPYGSRYIAA
ncbi:hypothetical protein [Roseateles koreensis]|uniref:Transposase n=1 Tax=Roseateles koreensis TaxID=2987526 RepID=A0ABT5KPP2_9BURK|nr:hypothetical protein [Roseateles koreensis]MDC8784893.1 hypothetical protein [Roseateles koreensis]